MWNVGDRIQFIKEGREDSTLAHFTIGGLYTIVQMEDYEGRRPRKYKVENDQGEEWWIETNSFALCKSKGKIKPTNEIEFLDAFKINFKDGI